MFDVGRSAASLNLQPRPSIRFTKGARLPSLFVIRGNDQGVRFDLGSERVTLGRESTNAIQLHDREVSRAHAEVLRDGRYFTIADLDSSNGTFVNGERIKSRQLDTGDHVQLGRTTMLFTGVI